MMNESERVAFEDIEAHCLILEEALEEAVETILHVLETREDIRDVCPSDNPKEREIWEERLEERRVAWRHGRKTWRTLKSLLIKSKHRRGMEYEESLHNAMEVTQDA